MEQEGLAKWMKLHLSDKKIIDAFSNEDVGEAVKALLEYLRSGEEPDINGSAGILFRALLPNAQEAITSYQMSIQYGSSGGKKAAANRRKRNTKEAEENWL